MAVRIGPCDGCVKTLVQARTNDCCPTQEVRSSEHWKAPTLRLLQHVGTACSLVRRSAAAISGSRLDCVCDRGKLRHNVRLWR